MRGRELHKQREGKGSEGVINCTSGGRAGAGGSYGLHKQREGEGG